MSETFVSGFRILIVPGLHGSDHRHWQSRWQCRYPSFERVVQVRWDVPHLPTWSERLGQVLHQSARPTLVVAHSFGCLATLHRAHAGAPNLVGALLVAPADPVKFSVVESLLDVRLACPSVTVGSLDDPWMEGRRAAEWAKIWVSEFVDAGALGHINAESGLGDWPFGLALLRRLAATVHARTHTHTRHAAPSVAAQLPAVSGAGGAA
jgi:uncharacterized protein